MERLMEGRWCVCTKTSAHEGVAWCVGGWVTPRRLGDSWLWEEQTVILFAEKVTVRRGSWLQKKKVMDLVLPYWFEAFVGYPRRDGWKIAGHLSPELRREIWAGVMYLAIISNGWDRMPSLWMRLPGRKCSERGPKPQEPQLFRVWKRVCKGGLRRGGFREVGGKPGEWGDDDDDGGGHDYWNMKVLVVINDTVISLMTTKSY